MEICNIEEITPPFDVDDSEVAVADSDFFEKSLEYILSSTYNKKFDIGRVLVTYSSKWGGILRANFYVSGAYSGDRICRFVAWRKDDGNFILKTGFFLQLAPI